MFKTSLVGNLVVVSGDSELNQYIFKEEGKSVYCSYTESALKIMGEQSLLAYHGVFHKYLKNLTLSMIGPESLKEVLLHEMDAVTRKYLHSCSSYASFDVKEESANVSDPLIDFLISKPAFSMGKFHPVQYSEHIDPAFNYISDNYEKFLFPDRWCSSILLRNCSATRKLRHRRNLERATKLFLMALYHFP